jgi:hypothetical protein
LSIDQILLGIDFPRNHDPLRRSQDYDSIISSNESGSRTIKNKGKRRQP